MHYKSGRNIQETARKKWYGHVIRRDKEYMVKTVIRMDVEGRRKGRPKRRWMDSVNVNLREKGCRGRRRKTEQFGGTLSETSTPHKSGEKKNCWKKHLYPLKMRRDSPLPGYSERLITLYCEIDLLSYIKHKEQ